MKRSDIRDTHTHRLGLSFLFSAVIFVFLLITVLVTGAIMLFRVRHGLFNPGGSGPRTEELIFSMAVWSLVLGSLLSILLAKFSLKPVKQVINSMDSLAHGDFRTRLNFPEGLSRFPTATEVAGSFNHMAEELEQTEMLRADFVNNFSHEFKTPIVSVAGFADLLLEGNLSPEEQREYLKVISDESHRLANLATNVLTLTRVENQSILTDVTRFNLSEQIRNCLLLLEGKWAEKDLQPDADIGDIMYEGNRELLRQVWINLLDNAVRFADPGTDLRVTVTETPAEIMVAVTDTGPEIPAENLDRVFRKFWQGDSSHASPGNGIGLSIVKAVAELHGGKAFASSAAHTTVFTVVLPRPETRTGASR